MVTMKKQKRFSPKTDPDIQTIVSEFDTLNVEVRFEDGRFNSSLCRVDDQEMLLVNRKLPKEQMLQLLNEMLVACKSN